MAANGWGRVRLQSYPADSIATSVAPTLSFRAQRERQRRRSRGTCCPPALQLLSRRERTERPHKGLRNRGRAALQRRVKRANDGGLQPL